MGFPRASWKRLYSLDFTAQSNLTITGAHTIDGHTWTGENTGAAGTFAIQSGTGLVIAASSGAAAYGDNVRTAALIRVDLSALAPNWRFGDGAIRVAARVLLTSATLNFQFAKVGFEWATTPAQFHMLAGKGFSAAVNYQGQHSQGTTSSRDTVVTTSDDVIATTWSPPWSADFSTATFATYIPRTMTRRGSFTGGTQANTVRDASSGQPRVVLCAAPTGAASGFTATFTHLAVDQQESL